MPKKAGDKNNSIKEKLEYIGLDLENIPEELKEYKPLNLEFQNFMKRNNINNIGTYQLKIFKYCYRQQID